MLNWLRRFFLSPAGAPLWLRLLPYGVLGVLTLVFLAGGAYAWEYTNSSEFCGTACHTMPPEYTAYLISPHARVACVECHIGRDFITTRITRKAGDIKHIFATAFETYEYPIRAKGLRPARETCERCHFPEKFSDDSLREIKLFEPDRYNTPTSIYLVLKTGGGSQRVGLGRGFTGILKTRSYICLWIQLNRLSPMSRSYIETALLQNLSMSKARLTRGRSTLMISRRWTASPAITASPI
jgi:nitrate/TMAO reductase-like tetraheme cytochrome c subunit